MALKTLFEKLRPSAAPSEGDSDLPIEISDEELKVSAYVGDDAWGEQPCVEPVLVHRFDSPEKGFVRAASAASDGKLVHFRLLQRSDAYYVVIHTMNSDGTVTSLYRLPLDSVDAERDPFSHSPEVDYLLIEGNGGYWAWHPDPHAIPTWQWKWLVDGGGAIDFDGLDLGSGSEIDRVVAPFVSDQYAAELLVENYGSGPTRDVKPVATLDTWRSIWYHSKEWGGKAQFPRQHQELEEEFPEGSASELLEKLRSRLEETGQWSEWIDRVMLEGASPPYYPPERRPMPPQDT
jgi:hypothetical protein